MRIEKFTEKKCEVFLMLSHNVHFLCDVVVVKVIPNKISSHQIASKDGYVLKNS